MGDLVHGGDFQSGGIYIHIYVYICAYICRYIWMYIFIYIYMYVYTWKNVCTQGDHEPSQFSILNKQ
jgi:hypothetical protein